MTKFLIVGDLHGEMPKIHDNEFDAIIAPGDFCGDDIRPFILRYMKKKNKDGYADFNKICPPKKQEELEEISIQKGRKILEKLNSYNKPVFLVPGNWEPTLYQDGEKKREKDEERWTEIKKGLKNVYDVEYRMKSFKNFNIIGHGSTSAPEPLEILEIPEPLSELDEIKEMNKRVQFFINAKDNLINLITKSKKPVIFISHNIPYKTKLDKVNNPGTSAHKKHYGSTLAREIIEETNPLVCIGGHIHEGFGKDKINETLCINAGFGGDVNTILEIDDKTYEIIKIEFIGENKR